MNDSERSLIAATIEKYIEHEKQHGPMTRFTGCRCSLCETVRKYREKWDRDILARLTYALLPSEGDDWTMRCEACGAVGDLMDEPFPHAEGCLLRGMR